LFIIFLSASIPYQFVNITLVAAIMVQFIDGAVNLSSVFGKPKTVQDAWNFMNHASISLADMRIYSALPMVLRQKLRWRSFLLSSNTRCRKQRPPRR